MIGTIIRKLRTCIYTDICKKTAKHYGNELHINHWSKFTSKTCIGNNCHFNGIKVTGNGNVIIGNNFHSGANILILTSNHNYDTGKSIPYDNTTIDGDVIIEDNVWLGQNVTVLQGIRIGEGAIIQAGSVVVTDIPACSIAGGSPAKVFKKRDEQHYYKLKEEKSFF